MSMSAPRSPGFALPATIFTMLVMGALVTGGFYMARQESRIGVATENGGAAFYLAESGVTETIANWNAQVYAAMPLWSDTTLVDTLSQGVRSVTITRLADELFLVDGTGVSSRGGEMLGGATRRVGTSIRVRKAELTPSAALTTRGATTVRGSAEVDGIDAIPPGWTSVCPADPPSNKPGILIDDATQVGTSGGGTIAGVPAVAEDPSINDSTFTTFGEMAWQDLVDLADIRLGGGTINNTAPDSTVSGICLTGTTTNWGNPNGTGACSDYFPIIHSSGSSLRIQSGGVGQGILLVDGDLDLRGGFVFHGIIIVQGSFETQGSGNRVYGGVMASNVALESQALVGGSTITYSKCAAERAVENNNSLNRARPLAQRGWVDLSSAITY